MKPKILILITVILAISSGVNSQKDEVVEDAVYGEDASFILNQPVALNAKKFSEALKDQS